MFLELFMEVFFIKLKIKSCLINKNENISEIIETMAIKSKNSITFYNNNIKYKIINNDKSINLIRETENFIHNFNFILNKKTKSEYYLKEFNTNIEVEILATKINITNKIMEIEYKVIDTEEVFNYILEMSEN